MAGWRLGTLTAAITIVIALAVAPSAGAYVPRQPDSFFGVSSPNFYVMNQKGQSALLDSYLNHISAAGVGWVRDAVPWPDAEPTPPLAGNHTYRWGTFDSQITRFAQHGLTIQPVIRQTPLWAESAEAIQANCGRDGLTSAAGASDYGAFVGAYLRRYGRGGTFWAAHPGLPYEPVIRVELWNEPNWYPFACPGPDPERYAAMVAAGADAAHAVDPGVVVSIGGLVALKANTFSGSTLRGLEVGEFLKRMTTAVPSLPNKVDAVAIHLYDLDPDGDISLIGWLRSKMAAAGLGAESILVTEYGWHTQGGADSVPEELRAQLETAFVNQAPRLNCGVIGIAPHAWVTSEQDPANRENWWGIADPANGSPYPTGQAYADQVKLFEGTGAAPAPRRTIPVCNRPLPDADGDGTADQNDDYPLDASRQSGSGEAPGDPPSPAPPTDPPRVSTNFFGAMAGSSFSDIRSRRAQADSMRNGQLGASREIVDWEQIQPRENTDLSSDAVWADMDSRFLRLGLRGVRVLPTFTDAPSWATPSSPATTQADFAEFVKAFAQRYGRGGIFWQRNRHLDESKLAVRDYEIWDRGNLSQSWWDGSASAAEYASAYAQARAALDQVDPGARALVSLDQGGLNYAGFVRDMVAARPDLAGNVDGAFVQAGTSRTTPAVENVVAAVRSELDDTGNSSAPIDVGFGWYTSGAGAMTEVERAVFYGQVADRLARSDCGVGGVLARSWVTPQDDLSNTSAWYGMVDPQSFQLGTTALAYRDVTRTYLGYGPNAAPRGVVHTCFRQAPDTDGDGVPDAAEDYPLDPSNAVAEATAPPAPSIGSAPNEFSSSPGATFTYSANGGASYWCTLDGSKPVVCDPSGRSYQSLSPGQHTFTVRGLDSLGLVGPPTSYTWTIDNTDPNTAIESHPDATLLTDSAQFTFSSNESDATFLCKLDSAGYQSCDSPTTLNGLQDGSHTFRVAAVDRAGNGDATPDTLLVPGPHGPDRPHDHVGSIEWRRDNAHAELRLRRPIRVQLRMLLRLAGVRAVRRRPGRHPRRSARRRPAHVPGPRDRPHGDARPRDHAQLHGGCHTAADIDHRRAVGPDRRAERPLHVLGERARLGLLLPTRHRSVPAVRRRDVLGRQPERGGAHVPGRRGGRGGEPGPVPETSEASPSTRRPASMPARHRGPCPGPGRHSGSPRRRRPSSSAASMRSATSAARAPTRTRPRTGSPPAYTRSGCEA